MPVEGDLPGLIVSDSLSDCPAGDERPDCLVEVSLCRAGPLAWPRCANRGRRVSCAAGDVHRARVSECSSRAEQAYRHGGRLGDPVHTSKESEDGR